MQRVAAGLAGGDVKGQVVRDVTPRGQADEAQVLAGGAMVKMKAFLEAWAPQASIRLDEGKVNPVHTGADTGGFQAWIQEILLSCLWRISPLDRCRRLKIWWCL